LSIVIQVEKLLYQNQAYKTWQIAKHYIVYGIGSG